MATKNSNTSTMNKNKETIKKVSSKVHEELLSTSHLFIDETVATLTRMQKITGKVIKKSEPILEKQIEITFDAVEALKNQAGKGGKRALKLLGLTKQYNKLSNTIEEKVKEIPSVEEIIDDAKEFVGKAKSDVEEKIGDLKKMGGIEEIGKKAKTTVAKTAKKAKPVAKKLVAKTKAAAKTTTKTTAKVAKKTVAPKASVTKTSTKTVAAKVAKKTVAPKTSTAAAKASVSKVAAKSKATVAKKASAKKIAIAKKTEVAAKVQIAKSELTQIKGIGESLAGIMANNGIRTIADLKNASPEALKVIATKAGNRYKSFDTKNWITAAEAIAK